MSKQKITTTSLKAFNSNASINQRMTDTELLGFYVKQRKSGPFFYLDYSTLAGKRTLSIGNFPTITAEQARNLVKQYLGRIASGEDVRQTIEEEKTRIKEARLLTVKSYLENIYQTTLNRQKSGIHTRQALEKHLRSWMDKEINKIDARDVHKWQIEMENKELSFERIKGVFNMFKTMLNNAVKNGYIESHKLNGIKLEKPKLSQEEIDSSNTRNYLTKNQISQFFKALDKYQEIKRLERRSSRQHGRAYLPDLDALEFVDHVKPWLLFMYYSGFRPGDIFGLQWEHLNFHNNSVILPFIKQSINRSFVSVLSTYP